MKRNKKISYKKTSFFEIPEKKKSKKKLKIQKYIPSFSLGKNSKKLYYVATTVVVAIGIYSYIFGTFLRVESIFIVREDKIVNIDRSYEVLEYLRGMSMLSVSETDIAERLIRSQATTESVDLQKKYPNTLEINISSSQIVLQTDTSFILENGYFAEKRDATSDVPTIEIYSSNDESSSYLDPQIIVNILSLRDSLLRNIVGSNIIKIGYLDTEKEVFIRLNNTILIFDILSDYTSQIEKLAVYNRDIGDIDAPEIIYIDARINRKIFTCDRENSELCIDNLGNIYGSSIAENFIASGVLQPGVTQ